MSGSPSYLARRKAVIKLIRDKEDDNIAELTAKYRLAAGPLLIAGPLPFFARWRWRTLTAVVRWVSAILATLKHGLLHT